MTKKLGWLSAALLALLVFATARAEANVIYEFTGTISGLNYGPVPAPFSGPSLVVTDAAFQSGSLSLSIGPGICPNPNPIACPFSGNTSGLVSFGYAGFNDFFGGSPPSGGGRLSLNVSFNPNGTLTGSIFEAGYNSEFNIAGSEFDWSGSFSADNARCFAFQGQPCTISGAWRTTSVPEPITLAFFGAGVLGVLGVRRRRRKLAHV